MQHHPMTTIPHRGFAVMSSAGRASALLNQVPTLLFGTKIARQCRPDPVEEVAVRRQPEAAGPAAENSPSTRDSQHKIRVLLADDHQILRDGLASLLSEEPDIEVVGQAADGQEAIDLARNLHPDVVLMDITMPRLDGIQATRLITAELSGVAVIGLSMHEESDMAAAMRAAGAIAYLSKGGPSDALIATIRAVR